MKKGFGKAISTLASAAVGAVAGGAAVGNAAAKKRKKSAENGAKLHALYMAYDQWLQLRQEGKTLVEYFKREGYQTIAIYGMKELGKRLYEELNGSGIKVAYCIDKNADSIYADVDVVTPDEELEPVDVIVVTAIYYFDEIEEMLGEKVDYPVISLEDILYEERIMGGS